MCQPSSYRIITGSRAIPNTVLQVLMESILLRQSRITPATSGGKAMVPQEKIRMQGLRKQRLRLLSVTLRTLRRTKDLALGAVCRFRRNTHTHAPLLSSIEAMNTLSHRDRQVVKQSSNHARVWILKRRCPLQHLLRKALRTNHKVGMMAGAFEEQCRQELRLRSSPAIDLHPLRHPVNLGGKPKDPNLNKAITGKVQST